MEQIVEKAVVRQIIRFLFSGGIAALVDIGIYASFVNTLGLFYAKVLSFCLATVVSFFLNKYLTFSSKAMDAKEIIKFILLYIVSAYLNGLINEKSFSVFHSKPVAFCIATGFCMVLNFSGQKYFVFRK